MHLLLLTPLAPGRDKHLPELHASITRELDRLPQVHATWRIQLDTADPVATQDLLGRHPYLTDPRITVRPNGRQRGPAITRTIGLVQELTTRSVDIVTTIDADDMFTETGLALLVQPFQDDPHLAWACGGNTWYDDESQQHTATYPPGGNLAGYTPPGAVWTAWQDTGIFPFAAATCAYRPDAVLAAGGWPGTPTGEDAALLLAVSDHAPGWSVPQPVFDYRKHAAQSTNTHAHSQLRELTHTLMHARHHAGQP